MAIPAAPSLPPPPPRWFTDRNLADPTDSNKLPLSHVDLKCSNYSIKLMTFQEMGGCIEVSCRLCRISPAVDCSFHFDAGLSLVNLTANPLFLCE